MCFFNSAEEAYLDQNDPYSTLKTIICRKYSFQKLTPFSQGSNVPNAPASDMEDFLDRGTCVSST
jgi:hypothetical protein